ncbi:LysR substrate-binding domain-containing protein [Pseudomonas guariconensis]|uniref:LysR substrate-binding domain-containing protein n=1 Tax=Pseudomonas TaxID=286 RepID=UPI001CE3E6F7|nr:MULTISPECIES: LysR substrate-binding domain-containing protein [Pseudomonas]MCO7637526.1 LysR substrate-binding domain-containing protein [Pseudomonas sp. S 311-6]MCO7513959.1 LysR substrate-binding domain-containing protein [Pseudomonas putida]MCO7563970.1 LysR substrate-binding domain-containing protein [Pseudomonas mosselii]MCO7593840.1 LysR substrate-binding domain-containing protein [Pseudomonas guariconensis]MCO7604977.1 LysR substrate-binding domain-containing protein [Pseudomonas gu
MLKHWPPLNALRGFEAAARLGSFHKAAEELHLTQSAISQQIRSLEGFLEQPLFLRNGRRVALTDAGFDLLSTTQSLLQQLAVGIRRLDQYRKPNQLVVNTTPAFARHWLVPHLADFHRQHPQVDLWLLTTDETPDMATQTIDIAVRDDLSAQAECSFRVLLEDRLYPACHPDLLDTPVDRRTTLHGEREMDWSHWQVQGGRDVGQHSQGLNFSDPGLLLDAAAQGLGIALVSQLLAAPARERGLLVPLDDQRVRGPKWACLVHRDSEADPLSKSFCDWLSRSLQIRDALE